MFGKTYSNGQPPATTPPGWKILFLYLAACLLVVGFVNLFTLYRVAEKLLGKELILYMVPLLPAVVLLFFVRPALSKMQTTKIRRGYLCCGLILLALGLTIPNPAVGVKRIHVTEYLLLSLLIRYTMAFRLRGMVLLLFSCLATTILGIHDEFLQGIHPLRTYGLRDMLVNSISGCGGSLLWHSFSLFGENSGADKAKPGDFSAIPYLVWMPVTIIAMVVPLPGYLNRTLPLWPFLPLATVPLWWALLPQPIGRKYQHGITVCSWLILPFFIYPVLVNGLSITFF